jgi:hypothetical protein
MSETVVSHTDEAGKLFLFPKLSMSYIESAIQAPFSSFEILKISTAGSDSFYDDPEIHGYPSASYETCKIDASHRPQYH